MDEMFPLREGVSSLSVTESLTLKRKLTRGFGVQIPAASLAHDSWCNRFGRRFTGLGSHTAE